jgi:hypothetical protein
VIPARSAPSPAAPVGVRPVSKPQSSAASCSAVLAPEPRAGLIAWMASPSMVTRLGGHGGTGGEVRILTRNVSSTAARACSARRSGCQLLISFAVSACRSAGAIAVSRSSDTPNLPPSPATAHIR